MQNLYSLSTCIRLIVSLLAITGFVGNLPKAEAGTYQTRHTQLSSGDQPTVTHVASGGLPGDLVMISGRQLQAVTSVLFNGVPVKPTKVDPRGFFLQVNVPKTATTGPITIQTGTSQFKTNVLFRVLPRSNLAAEIQQALDSDRDLTGVKPLASVARPMANVPALQPVKAVTGATISGLKFEDLDRDGTRTVQTSIGSPIILFVVDVSGSTTSNFAGTTVGDLNGRNGANTILDAEIGVVERIRTELIGKGAVNSQIGIVTFATDTSFVDLNPVLPGVQPFAKVGDDKNSNGRSDISDSYTTVAFTSAGNTYYERALQKAILLINTVPSTQEVKLIFLSDGIPNPSNQVYSDEVNILRSKPNVSLSAIGIGADSELQYLQIIDPNARKVTDFNNLINFSLDIITPLENGLSGVVLYLDLNNNGRRDASEPFQTSATNNAATTTNETGTFSFTGLAAGTYTVREEVPPGYMQTAPASKSYSITVTGTQSYTIANFGNISDAVKPVILNVPAPLAVACAGDVPLPASDVRATDNFDPNPVLAFSETRVNGACANQYVITRTWTATDEAGNQTIASQQITVNDNIAPKLNGVPTQPVIVGSPPDACSTTINFPAITASDNCTGDITISYSVGGISVTPTSPFPLGATTVDVVATDVCGNMATSSFVVQVNDVTAPVPSLASLPGLTGRCTVVVSSSPTATDNCGGLINGTTTDPLTYTTPGTYTITWTYVDAASNMAKQQQVIQVTPPPAPPVVADVAYCLGSGAVPLSAIASPTGVLNWFGPTNSPLPGAPTPVVSSPGTTQYFVSQTVEGCTSSLATINVTVNALPIVSLTNLNAAYCKNAASVPLSGSPMGGTFSIDGSSASVLNPASLSVGSHLVAYSYTDSKGCMAMASQTVTITAQPGAPTLTTISGQLYAGGQNAVSVPQYSGVVTLQISGCSGAVMWQGPLNQTGTGTTIIVPTSATGTFIYTATCQQNGCTSTPASATVSVNAAPLRVVAPLFDCATGKLTLRTTGGNGLPIEFQIPSITNGWESTNPVKIDAKDFKKNLQLRARQRASDNKGYDSAELDYNLPTCPSARISNSVEPVSSLDVTVLGNPVVGQELVVEVRGAQGQPLRLQIVDLKGRLISQHVQDVADVVEQHRLSIGQQPAGVMLLQVSTPTQRKQIKVLKP